MPTLLLPPRYTTDSVALWQAAINEGWATKRLQSWHIKENLTGQIAIYGEHLFALAIAEQLNLALLRPPFDWLAQLPHSYLQRKIWFAQLDAINHHSFPTFVKPADDKCFPAKVYENALALPDANQLPAETPILVAEPVTWRVEFRSFILDKKLAAISVYSRNGQFAQTNDGVWLTTQAELAEATVFINQVLADPAVLLPPAVVLDVGVIEGRGWAVVEANPAWASGIYGCEPRQVLHTIARSCCPANQLAESDKSWVIG